MQLLPVLVAGGVAGLAILLIRLLDAPIKSQVGVFAHLLGGHRADGWPVGVQEEDRDRPWGRRPSAGPADAPADAEAPTVAVRPVTRLRA